MKKYFSICLLLTCFNSYGQQAFNSAGSAGSPGNFGLDWSVGELTLVKTEQVDVDDKSIPSLDPAGIALKAIQYQQTLLEAEQDKNAAQQKQIDILIAQNKIMMAEIEKLKK